MKQLIGETCSYCTFQSIINRNLDLVATDVKLAVMLSKMERCANDTVGSAEELSDAAGD